MTFDLVKESDLHGIIEQLWQHISGHKIILFKGNLGAGKTTLIKEIGKHLGVTSDMSSPSFSIVNEYNSPFGIMYHIDLYRIQDSNEIYEFGLPEILDSGGYCFIEWPEKVPEIWQEYDGLEVTITIEKSGLRRIFVA
jgi:tRNA threonylcarbamoyladenosine biosynthesis protein TsaE